MCYNGQVNNTNERLGHMSSKKYANKNNSGSNKNSSKDTEFTSYYSRKKVWFVRIIVILLCITVAITLIPSVFF